MNFLNYTANGDVIIPRPFLRLSDMDREKKLQMFPLDRAMILLKKDMDQEETLAAIQSLALLADSLRENILPQAKSASDDKPSQAKPTAAEPEDDVFPLPCSVMQDAGLEDDDLLVLSEDGIVVIVRDDKDSPALPRLLDLAGNLLQNDRGAR